jgi:hypothetical protein
MPIRWHPNGRRWRNCRGTSRPSVVAANLQYSARASCKHPATATHTGRPSSPRRTVGTALCKLHLRRILRPTCKQAPGRARFFRSREPQAASNRAARNWVVTSRCRDRCGQKKARVPGVWQRAAPEIRKKRSGNRSRAARKGWCRRDLPTQTPPRCGCQRRDRVETNFRVVALSVVSPCAVDRCCVRPAKRRRRNGSPYLPAIGGADQPDLMASSTCGNSSGSPLTLVAT